MRRLKSRIKGSSVTRRLLSGFGANLLGKIWATLIQLISVPMLTNAWGLEGFGIWLMITTIPTYLALSDFGLGTAAGVDITRAVAVGQRKDALRAFQTVWLFLTIVTLITAVLVGLALMVWLEFSTDDEGSIFGHREIALAAFFVTIGALVRMQISIRKVVYQATHKYALGTTLNDIGFFAQGLAVITVAHLGGGIVHAAIAGVIISSANLLLYTRILKNLEEWCHIGISYADISTLRRLLKPSLAAFALTAANSFGIQGIVLTVGWTMGPAVAAIFATTRMLTRIPLQLSGLLTRASLPEFTRAQVADNTTLAKRLMHINLGLTLAIMGPAVIVMGFWGPSLLKSLSREEMSTSNTLFAILGLVALVNGIWTTHSTRLLAINRQGEYAWLVLFLYAIVALSPIAVGTDVIPITVALLLAEVMILVRVYRVGSSK